MKIRSATPADDPLLAHFYLALWASYGVPAEQIRPDAEARTLAFIRESRATRQLGAFIAEDDATPVGVAAAEAFRSPYPDVMREEHRHFGYIWCVYVEPAFRRRGIARTLTERCIEHLRAIGCTHATLNASDVGQALYEALGFALAREMRMELKR